jgi:hypothetical protein
LEIDRKIKTGEIDQRLGLELITNGIIGGWGVSRA